MTDPILYFEDLTPGSEFRYDSKRVDADDVIRFAREFDPQPMHLSEEAGKASILGGLSASGWHSCAMMMRLFYDSLLARAASEGSPGIDKVEWRRPVLAGDILTGRSVVLERRPLRSRPGIGLVRMRHEVVNQKGELVLAMENPGMFRMREAAREAAE